MKLSACLLLPLAVFSLTSPKQVRDNPIASYKTWPCLMKEPELVTTPSFQFSCIGPTQRQQEIRGIDPHFRQNRPKSEALNSYTTKKYVRVYINPLGKKALDAARQKAPKGVVVEKEPALRYFDDRFMKTLERRLSYPDLPALPVGTVVVKEKLSSPDAQTPELLTIMIKRNKGFNPSCGDWEFLVYEGDGKREQARGRITHCISCHSTYTKTDFLSRNYALPRLEYYPDPIFDPLISPTPEPIVAPVLKLSPEPIFAPSWQKRLSLGG
jgi:Cytochrome P460